MKLVVSKRTLHRGDAPIRIQIAVFGQLVAEAIVHQRDADTFWAKWAIARYRKDKPLGGAMMQHADLPRYWDVPVGGLIPQAPKRPSDLEREFLRQKRDGEIPANTGWAEWKMWREQ